MTQRIALVTGGARGIGRAIALTLAHKGVDVAVADILDAEGTAVEIRALGRRAMAVRFDVADFDQVRIGVDQIADQMGPIEILVSNAATTTNVAPLRKMEVSAWQREIAVNLGGAFNCCKAVLDGMVKARWGRIVCISSAAGFMGGFGQCAYTASKSGLLGLVRTITLEHARDNITANAVLPGLIKTDAAAAIREDMRKRILDTIPSKEMGNPEDIANVVAFLCSEEARYMNGADVKVTAGCELFTF